MQCPAPLFTCMPWVWIILYKVCPCSDDVEGRRDVCSMEHCICNPIYTFILCIACMNCPMLYGAGKSLGLTCNRARLRWHFNPPGMQSTDPNGEKMTTINVDIVYYIKTPRLRTTQIRFVSKFYCMYSLQTDFFLKMSWKFPIKRDSLHADLYSVQCTCTLIVYKFYHRTIWGLIRSKVSIFCVKQRHGYQSMYVYN